MRRERGVRALGAPLLGLTDDGPQPWHGDERFEVDVVDSPEEMEALLAQRLDDGYSAKLSAGYCWPWSDPRTDRTLVPDVRIGDWARPWNVKGDRRVGDADFDRLVRNVYKVLLTRGMRGTLLYSTDAQTRDALRRFVQG